MTIGFEEKSTAASYNMSEDAMGLADFISQFLANQKDHESPVIYVVTPDGAQCVKAEMVATSLTDDSVVYSLVLTFED